MQTRTWNNLIIFVMLGMLMLFFVLNQHINKPDSEAQLLIPTGMTLVRFVAGDIDLQRNSQGLFVQTGSKRLDKSSTDQLISAWERTVIVSDPVLLTDTQLSQSMHRLPVILTTYEFAASGEQIQSRKMQMTLITLPEQHVLQINARYYTILQPEASRLNPQQ